MTLANLLPTGGILPFWRGFRWQKAAPAWFVICCPCGCSSAAQVLPFGMASLMRPAFCSAGKKPGARKRNRKKNLTRRTACNDRLHRNCLYPAYHPTTSYQLAVAPNGMVPHTLLRHPSAGGCAQPADARMPYSDPGCWPDLLPQAFRRGTADNRTPAVIPEYADGTEEAAFVFDHAVVTPRQSRSCLGLPMFRTGEGVETLSVFLKDAGGLVVELRYSVYEAEDLITRTAVYTNAGTQSLTLHKAASLSVDFAPDALELITLNGTWAAERT